MIARALYRTITGLAAPMIDTYLTRRLKQGREDPTRSRERRGIPSLPRPDGALVWIHAASNGEAMSALPLINRLLDRDPRGHVLVTTGTVTSARLMAQYLPDRALHQFIPVDRTTWVRSFLDYWRPDAGIWVESEFWPALIWEMRAAGKPMALVNGRVSRRSLIRWRRISGIAADLLSGFQPCLAQTPSDADYLQSLGARNADCVGNLKLSVPPLPANAALLAQERARIGSRPIWLAASTHPGEEEIIAEAHRLMQDRFPDLLTILVPRHPKRGGDITEYLQKQSFPVSCRSQGGEIDMDSAIHVADTLGELGLFYRLAPVAFIGGSLCGGHGGHNPIEAALLGCAPIHGPDMANFSTVAEDLAREGGAITIHAADELADAVTHLLSDETARSCLATASAKVAQDGAGTADRVLARLELILPPINQDQAS